MKKLNTFLDKAPLWQVFIFGHLTLTLMVSSVFYFTLLSDSLINLTALKCLELGGVMGIPFGLIFVLSTYQIRKSQDFWNYSKEVNILVDNADSKEKLESIFTNEFESLRGKCQGLSQAVEVKRIEAIIRTKYKYLPNIQ